MLNATSQLSPALSEQPLGTMTRRDSLRLLAAASLSAGTWPWHSRATESIREYHVCLSPQAVLEDPEFPAMLRAAGVTCVWLAGFFYGHWPWPLAFLQAARDRLERA